MTDYRPNLIIPIGTQIVTHVDIKNSSGDVIFVRGVVGVIIKSPVDATHGYRVRYLPIGSEEESLDAPSQRACLR